MTDNVHFRHDVSQAGVFDTRSPGMKKNLLFCSGVIVILLATAIFTGSVAADSAVFGPAAVFAGAGEAAYVPESILVMYDSECGDLPDEYLNPQYTTEILRKYNIVPGLYEVKLAGGMSAEQACSVISALPGVVYAEPNYRISLSGGYKTTEVISTGESFAEDNSNAVSSIPNDIYYPKQWGLNSPTAGISAEGAWAFAEEHRKESGDDIVIAVIDSGVDYYHPDLKNRMWTNPGEIPDNGIDDDENGYIDDYYGWHFAYNSSTPLDYFGHGTYCAGIAAAETNNRIGIAGTAGMTPGVKIMAVGVFNAEEDATVSDLISGIEYAVENGADILNISWGGNPGFNPFEDALKEAEKRGILVVCSAGSGNHDTDDNPEYPASTEGNYVISVASSGQDNKKTDFSNWGKTSVDIAAPGMNNLSTSPSFAYTTLSSNNLSRDSQYPISFMINNLESSIPDDYRRYTADSLELKYTGPDGEWMHVGYLVEMGNILPGLPEKTTVNSADVTFALHNGTFQVWIYNPEPKEQYYTYAIIYNYQESGTMDESVQPVSLPYDAIMNLLGISEEELTTLEVRLYFEPYAADGYLTIKNVSFKNKKLQTDTHTYTDTYGIEAPVISGAAAVLLSVEPDLTPAEIRTVLMDTVDKNRKWGWEDLIASGGRLNLERAVKTAHPVKKSSSSQGTSIWLTAAPTPTPAATPAPTPVPTPDAPTVKPIGNPTQKPASPAPFMGVLAGVGAAAVVFGLRRK